MTLEGKNILACWLGNKDIDASRVSTTSTSAFSDVETEAPRQKELGPIAQLLQAKPFDKVYLLISSGNFKKSTLYLEWLKTITDQVVEPIITELKDPTDYSSIYREAINIIDTIRKKEKPLESIAFHLSPGTPAMAATWVLVGKTYVYHKLGKPADFYQTWQDKPDNNLKAGFGIVDIPFDIEADFLEPRKDAINRILLPDYDNNIFIAESKEMKLVLDKVARLAPWKDVNVLIEGASGTGKEYIATLIHKNSDRRSNNFIAINCGAIAKDLVESTLFGHKKGAFTGATYDKPGCFEETKGGTIFLDEIGDLRPSDQATLLRVLQEKKVQRVGETKSIDCDFRVVAATNRSLIHEVAKGDFRDDLYFRLVTGYIKLPTLKERKEDFKPLVNSFIKKLNKQGKSISRSFVKHISQGAFVELRKHDWPGNIRELESVLKRAAIFYDGDTITREAIKNEIQQLVSPYRKENGNELLPQLDSGEVNLVHILDEIQFYYIIKAMELNGNNRDKAAKMLGYASHGSIKGYILQLESRGMDFSKKPKGTK